VYEIKYYKEKKRFPVLEFIERLPSKVMAKLLRNIDLLENNGFDLGFPFISRITGTDELWELRTKFGHNNYRIIFFHYRKGLFVLLHAFIKKTSKIPEREIQIALSRLNRYKERRK
jgi:phage-related protein